MSVETRAPTDLQDHLTEAAAAAIADVMPAVEADVKRVKRLTFEIELSGGRVQGAHCWIERGVNLGRLLGDRGPK